MAAVSGLELRSPQKSEAGNLAVGRGADEPGLGLFQDGIQLQHADRGGPGVEVEVGVYDARRALVLPGDGLEPDEARDRPKLLQGFPDVGQGVEEQSRGG